MHWTTHRRDDGHAGRRRDVRHPDPYMRGVGGESDVAHVLVEKLRKMPPGQVHELLAAHPADKRVEHAVAVGQDVSGCEMRCHRKPAMAATAITPAAFTQVCFDGHADAGTGLGPLITLA